MDDPVPPIVEVSLGETGLEPVTLAPRAVMHGAADEKSELDDRVSLAQPRVDLLDPEAVTAIAGELVGRYADKHAGSLRFCLLTVDVGFHHVAGEPVVQAALNVRLFNDPPNGHPEPVAIALVPALAARAVKRSSTIRLGANLSVINSEVGRNAEHESSSPYLQAHKPGRSDPAWFFTRTPQQELVGPHQLMAVVAMPAEGHCKALVDLSASIRRRRVGLVGYEARLRPDFRLVDLV